MRSTPSSPRGTVFGLATAFTLAQQTYGRHVLWPVNHLHDSILMDGLGQRHATRAGGRSHSGSVGRITVFAIAGSSLSLTYTGAPSLRGTLTLVSAKPIGIETVCLNSGSAATESIRKRFVPMRVHCSSGLAGQRISFNEGVRTRVTNGCQSPFAPLASTGRNRSGPNADGPKLLRGSSVAKTLCASCRTRSPSLRLKRTLKELSAAATSIFSVLGNVSGISV